MLQPTFAAFITMNPGYSGRTELPQSLKIQFRPIAMMIPDYRYIAEVSMFAEGVIKSTKLGEKLVLLFRACSEQVRWHAPLVNLTLLLSSAPHRHSMISECVV